MIQTSQSSVGAFTIPFFVLFLAVNTCLTLDYAFEYDNDDDDDVKCNSRVKMMHKSNDDEDDDNEDNDYADKLSQSLTNCYKLSQ